MNHLRAMLLNEDADIFFLQETYLSPDTPDTLIIGGTEYNLYRTDRKKRTGGGVAVLSHRSLLTTHIQSPPDLELVAIDLSSRSHNYRLVSAYRAPNSTPNNILPLSYLRNLCDYLITLESPNRTLILAGDFNLPRLYGTNGHLAPTDQLSLLFDECTDTLSLTQLNRHPSRPNTDNVLDLIFCPSTLTSALSSPAICEEFLKSDHLGLSFTLEFRKPPNESQPPYRNYRKGDYTEFNHYLSTIDWDWLYQSSTDISNFSDKITEQLNRGTILFVPMSQYKNSTKLPFALQRLRKKRRKLFLKRTTHSHQYKDATKSFTKALRTYLSNNEKVLIDNGNLKGLYNHVKRRTKDKTSDFPLTNQGIPITNPIDKANTFSEYFSSVYTNSDNNTPIIPLRTQGTLTHFAFYETRINKALKILKPKLSSGPDGIPMYLLKKVRNTISYPLSLLYDWSFSSGTCPSSFLQTRVTPVFKKKGSRSLTENYRPISIGSAIAKVMEKLITDRLLTYLQTNHLLSDHQHGFLPSRSTTTQLLSCVNDWTSLKASNRPCYVVYLDFKKAFDSVDHSKLTQKLEAYGIQGPLLKWIKAYLSNRTQSVSIASILSDPKPIISGILQGSCIGPILFLIFINDLLDSFPDIKLAAYADDIKLYHSNPLLIQTALDRVSNWCNLWQLSLSPTKCCGISLGSGPSHTFSILDNPIPNLTSIVDLGVTIDPTLNFSAHVKQMVKKAKQASWVTLKCFTSGNRANLIKAYTTYVRPKLEYCTQVWSPQTKADSFLIERVQKHFTRQIYFRSGLKKKPYELRLKTLKLDTLEDRRIKQDMTLAHKIYHELTFCPNLLQRKHISRPLVHNYRLQQDTLTPKYRSLFFSNRIVPLWNKFTDEQIHFTAGDFYNLLNPNK